MSDHVWELVSQHWPALTLVGTLLVGIYFCVKTLALTFESIGNALGPIGKFWRDRRVISRAEIDDLQCRITYLDGQVRALRYRDLCYFSFVLADEQLHYRQELLAAKSGWPLERHVSFLEYRDKWLKDRNLTDSDLNIWQ